MLLAVISLALADSLNPSPKTQFYGYDRDLQKILSPEPKAKGLLRNLDDDKDTHVESLNSLERKVGAVRSKDVMGSALYVAILAEEHKPIPKWDLDKLRNGKTESSHALGEAYSPGPLSKARADQLAAKLSTTNLFVSKLATIHAYERAGDLKARTRLLKPRSMESLLLLGLLVLVLFGGCGLSWITYFAGRSDGYFRPLGIPLDTIDLPTADRLAIRAARLLATFLGVELVSALALRSAPVALEQFVQGALMLTAVFLLIRSDGAVDGIGFRKLGLTKDGLLKNTAWGIGGFLAELPLAMLLAVILTKLLEFLPSPQHPAQMELALSRDPFAILSTIFLGTIVAPIWEEIMFRGLLFPALSRVFKNVPIGAVASSIIFASVHPQGLALWAALATTGLASCAISYHTKSLVPSIILHFCHNMVLMVLTLAYARS